MTTAPPAVRPSNGAPEADEPALSRTSRRALLAALAAGVVAVACDGSEQVFRPNGAPGSQPAAPGSTSPKALAGGSTATTAVPTSTSVTAGAGSTPDVVLPVALHPTAPPPAVLPQTAGGPAGTGAGSGAAPRPGLPASSTGVTAPPPAAVTSATAPASSQPPATAPSAPPASAPSAPSAPPVVLAPGSVSAQVELVGSRLTYGFTPSLRAEIANQGVAAFVADQLSKSGPDPACEGRLQNFVLMGKGPTATYTAYQSITTNRGGRLQAELTHSNLVRAVHSRHQLFEMMCQLWMDHVNINLADSAHQHLMMHYQERVIRPNAMGSFRDLLRATANSGAMLTYLNNDISNANSAQGVNENYGRELLELHTLGIDENGKQIYTEADVQAAARAMSGWSLENRRAQPNYSEFLFRPQFQHTGTVSILGGAWTSDGTTGKATGDSLVDFLASHPTTARHVAFKICRRFVADIPPTSLVESTAAVFLANDTQIVPTLRHVFTSAEFSASSGLKLRRPIESVAAILRSLAIDVPGDPDSDGAKSLASLLRDLDHLPWGWPQPDGFPDAAVAWLTSPGLLTRWNFGANAARGAVKGLTLDLARIRPNASTADDLIGALGLQFGLGALSAADRQAAASGSGIQLTDPAAAVTNDKLMVLIGLLFAHPLFQTR